VRALLGDAPRRRDLLIEHLHRIQDARGCLSAAHLVALAQEMKLAMAEVYEVATFYHHFDVVKEGEAPPPPSPCACARRCRARWRARRRCATASRRSRREVRVIGAPCIGRCEHAPAAVVGRHTSTAPRPPTVLAAVRRQRPRPRRSNASIRSVPRGGGYRTSRACVAGERTSTRSSTELETSALRGLGGAGFPSGRKWKIVRAEPAPRLMAVNIDEGEPGTFKDRYYLERDPHRFIEGMLIAAWAVGIDGIYVYLRDEYAACRAILARARGARRRPAVPAARDRPAPRRGRVHLRRRVGDDRVDRGQARHAAPASAVRRAGRTLRPPDARAQHGDAVLGARHPREGRRVVRGQGRNGRKGLRSFSVSGRVRKPGVHLAPAGITVRELIDEYCGGMQDGHSVLRLPAGRRVGRHPARVDGRHPARLRHAAAARLLHRLGGRRHPVAARSRARRRREPDEVLRRRIVRAVHACRVGTEKAVVLMEQARWDTPLLAELSQAMADASICGLGQAAPNPIACVVKHFPHELAATSGDRAPMNAPERSLSSRRSRSAQRRRGERAAGRDDHRGRDRLGVEIPRLCYAPGMRPDGNCRSCMVEIKGERVLAPSCCRAPAAGMDVRATATAPCTRRR
jgi:formate dehydrogenase